MKPFLVALLLGISGTLTAQEAFYFDPRIGSPAGGDAIRVVANSPSIDFRCVGCPMPQIFFGGSASPLVTVIDSRTLTAITPPHAEAVVNVELRLAGVTYTTEPKFGYARPRGPVLIPVAIEVNGAFGTRWTTDMWVYNDADETVNLMPEVCVFIGAVFPCGNPLLVAAHSALRIPTPFQRDGSFPEMYLFPPSDVRDRLHFNVRVRNASNANDLGTEIPVVRFSDFRDSRVVLVNVPTNDRFRSVLRIYDQERIGGASISVRVYDMTTGALLARHDTGFRPAPTDNPLRFSFSLYDVLNDPGIHSHDFVRIEVEEADADLWAMLTLTDNATQRVTVLTSQ